MSVAMLIDNPNGSEQMYAALRAKLELDGPLGGIVHIAGPGPQGGWRVIEIWNSVEEASRFLKERFAPALAELGATGPPPEPQFWPVDNVLTGATSSVVS